MEAWQALSNIFSDPEFAAILKGGERFWAYTYTFPSTAQSDLIITMEAGVSYSAFTGLFSKYVCRIEEE